MVFLLYEDEEVHNTSLQRNPPSGPVDPGMLHNRSPGPFKRGFVSSISAYLAWCLSQILMHFADNLFKNKRRSAYERRPHTRIRRWHTRIYVYIYYVLYRYIHVHTYICYMYMETVHMLYT